MRATKSPLRVLVSARDAGSAHQSRAFIETASREQARLIIRVLVQGPASSVFDGADIDTVPFLGDDEGGTQTDAALDGFRPDFVLVGLSGGGGVDEALLTGAHRVGVPTGAIQDYWGFLGPIGARRLPDVFFVIDQRARELTLARTGGRVRAEVTGSPRHERYQDRLAEWVGPERPGNPVKQAAFFMQPSQIPGMLENLEAFLQALQCCPMPVRALVRQHPAEPHPDRIIAVVAAAGMPVDVEPPAGEIEAELAQQDLICTCFSSVGLDHNYLQLYAPRALGALAYLAVGEEIKASMRKFIGTDIVPGAAAGMGVRLDTPERLGPWIAGALGSADERDRYREAVRANLASPIAAARRIEHVIHQMSGSHIAQRPLRREIT